MNIDIKNAFKEFNGKTVLEIDSLTFGESKIYESMGINENKKTTLLEKYLSCFDIEELLMKNAKKLSFGEQAKIALLRSAVLETEVTFLDEPTASMDIEGTLRAERLIESMASDNRTVILVTHDLYQAERIADYVVFLDKEELLKKGKSIKFLIRQYIISLGKF